MIHTVKLDARGRRFTPSSMFSSLGTLSEGEVGVRDTTKSIFIYRFLDADWSTFSPWVILVSV